MLHTGVFDQLLRSRFGRRIIYANLTSDVCFFFLKFMKNINFITKLLFYCPFHRSPVDWKTPLGFLITSVFEALSFFAVVLCLIQTLCFYTGSCWLLITFAKDIANDLELLNVGGRSDRSRKKMRERFSKVIQIHMDVKQLSTK